MVDDTFKLDAYHFEKSSVAESCRLAPVQPFLEVCIPVIRSSPLVTFRNELFSAASVTSLLSPLFWSKSQYRAYYIQAAISLGLIENHILPETFRTY